MSRSLRDIAYKALRINEELTAKNEREPSVEEIAKVMGVESEQVVRALDAIADPVSLYEPIYNDGGDAIFVIDQVRDEKSMDEHWLEEISLKEGIKRLGDREKHILNLRFYKGRTQMEVAKEIGISQAQVSRLEKTALGHVKKYI